MATTPFSQILGRTTVAGPTGLITVARHQCRITQDSYAVHAAITLTQTMVGETADYAVALQRKNASGGWDKVGSTLSCTTNSKGNASVSFNNVSNTGNQTLRVKFYNESPKFDGVKETYSLEFKRPQ